MGTSKVAVIAAALPVLSGRQEAFVAAVDQARHIVTTSPGTRRLTLSRCIERPSTFLLLVEWESVKAHTEGSGGPRRSIAGASCCTTSTTRCPPCSTTGM